MASHSRTDRILTWIGAALIVAGTLLGISRNGEPLVARARELFIPGGLILLVIAWRSRHRAPAVCVGIGLLALALIGVGAHEAASGPWTLLAIPGAVAGCLVCLRSAARGPRDDFFNRMRSRRGGSATRRTPRSVGVTRLWLVCLAALLGFGVELAVAAALPPGPTVDVEVVPLAYGADPSQGIEPNLFGLGVRQAHCSGGATAYTLAVRGALFTMSCANTSGARPRPAVIGLRAGQSYTVTIRALQVRSGRNPQVGNAHTLSVRVPAANSKSWRSTS